MKPLKDPDYRERLALQIVCAGHPKITLVTFRRPVDDPAARPTIEKPKKKLDPDDPRLPESDHPPGVTRGDQWEVSVDDLTERVGHGLVVTDAGRVLNVT